MTIAEEDYRRWDAVAMAGLVRSGDVSPQDLADTARELLQRQSGLNAVAAVTEPTRPDLPDNGNGPAGALAGVPFAVKELLAWPGLPWAMGSRLLAGNPAPGLSPYASRLRDVGLNVICSTTSSEFGLLGSTETLLHGITRNPWRDGLSAGGSSGGSAALVAAGVVPMAHGSDAGGSLRVPAALNGLFGFKPSNGRCAPTGPDTPGLAALVVEHVMSRSVRDSAHVLAATQRTGPDAVHPPMELVTAATGTRLRIGLLLETLTSRTPDDAARRETERVATLCTELGHDVELIEKQPVDGAALSRAFFTTAALTMAQVAQLTAGMLGRPPGPDELEPFTLELIDWAASLDPQAPADAERSLAEAAGAYLTLFAAHDVVLSPTLAVTSWPIGHLSPEAGRETLIRRTEEAVCYTPVHNAAGCPAMTVPLGRHDGLPVGVHFAAAPGADAMLLSLAYALEEASPWADLRPPATPPTGRTR